MSRLVRVQLFCILAAGGSLLYYLLRRQVRPRSVADSRRHHHRRHRHLSNRSTTSTSSWLSDRSGSSACSDLRRTRPSYPHSEVVASVVQTLDLSLGEMRNLIEGPTCDVDTTCAILESIVLKLDQSRCDLSKLSDLDQSPRSHLALDSEGNTNGPSSRSSQGCKTDVSTTSSSWWKMQRLDDNVNGQISYDAGDDDDASFVSALEYEASLDSMSDAFFQLVLSDDEDYTLRTAKALPLIQPDRLLYSQVLDMIVNSTNEEQKRKITTCRSIRTQLFSCSSDDEFLAKLHCLRQGFNAVMSEAKYRNWWTVEGGEIVADLLTAVGCGHDVGQFKDAYLSIVTFVEGGQENIDQMMDELRCRGVTCCNFFDIVLDYILIDSLQDLEDPPSSVTSVMANRWLSQSFKQSAINTAIWGMIKAKRSILASSTGFKARFYDITTVVTPALVWAFFGADESRRNTVHQVKHEVIGLARDLFSFERMDYASVSAVSRSIKTVCEARLATIKSRLRSVDIEEG